MQKELGREIEIEAVKEKLKAHFANLFNADLI
jgi:hypothetical protein